MTASYNHLLGYEEIITDMRAMLDLLLHASENCEPAEWGEMRNTANTSFYLIREMLQKLEANHDKLWKIELAASRAERGEHPH